MPNEVIRTDEQVKKFLGILEAELVELPDQNAFGDSNAESKIELLGWIHSLMDWLQARLLPSDKYDEIGGWLTGSYWSTIAHDYGMEEEK